MITSIQNEKVKLAKMLQGAAKARRKEGLMVLEGVRLVRDALLTGHMPTFLLTTAAFHDETVATITRDKQLELLEVADEVMTHTSDTQAICMWYALSLDTLVHAQ
jgi:tRNA G18 (ribose-2'-O)-methylase SpoU